MNRKEIWKSIPNYEAIYEISNFGRVKSLSRNCPQPGKSKRILNSRILKPSKDGGDYLFVGLYKHKTVKLYKIHRLVAISFLNKPKQINFTDINHIDGNKSNNYVDNLEWCDKSHNMKHAYELGLMNLSDQNGKNNSNAKRTIRIDNEGNEIIFETLLDAAKSINSSSSNLYYAIKHNNKHRGFYFKFHKGRV